MKRQLVIVGTLVALALPALARAQEEKASADALAASTAVEQRSVDASELADLLVAKGVITPQEQKTLTHPTEKRSIDEKALQEYFNTEPYRDE